MILPVHDQIRARVTATLEALYGLEPGALPPFPVVTTPDPAMGDLAVTVAFELARRLRKAPRAIAQEIAAAVGPMPGIARVEAAPNGYLNVALERPAFLAARLAAPAGTPAPAPLAGKVIVEHTAINPNKAAHIGHLRNAALGDTLVRALRFQGTPVEVQNYIDDTGVQVADVVVGFRELERMGLDEIRRVADSSRFDYYCWDLYARVTDWYRDDRARLAVRADALHAIERGEGEMAEVAALVAERIVVCHLRTMARLNVDYDLLTWEGDILHLEFWARAFEILKQTGAVHFQTEGRLAGCWVMPIQEEGATAAPQPAGAPPPPADQNPSLVGDPGRASQPADDRDRDHDATDTDDRVMADDREKVIVRSNGTVTYVGKDIAYQFWKFGALGRDFHYRRFASGRGGRTVWATSRVAGHAEPDHPPFGDARAVFNVIDVRQAYLQKLLRQGLLAIGRREEAERSTHFAYEMVALSHATARTLGYQLSDDDLARPFVEVSGRKGLGVKADDLLDILTEKAEAEVGRRNPEIDLAERRRTAAMIAVAAIRYFMVKFSRVKVIAFDIDEALNFEGESGPYLQYAVVRATNIFQKLRDREGLTEAAVLASLPVTSPGELNGDHHGHDLWALVFEAARLDEIVEQAVRTLEFSGLAKWAFGLAQRFNAFYHRYPILNEEHDAARRWRAAGVSHFRTALTRALDLMGIEVPARM